VPDIQTSAMVLILVAGAAYLLGSVPFGIVMARIFGLGDLRAIGSGNIGATNVLRTGNKLAAFLTLILDAGQGGIAVLVARAMVGDDAAQIAGFFAFIGHLFPVYLRFKGGKGVATFLGTLLALSFPIGVACCATWLVTAGISRYSSLSALTAAAMSTVWAVLLTTGETMVLCTLLTLLVYWSHRENIARLKAGTETKIGKKG
jgi:glycerol-3-phosphate acyltransferase PlsY